MTYMTESEALQELGTEQEVDDWFADEEAEQRKADLRRKIAKMVALREVALKAKVGERIACPCCGKSFVKKTYNKVFCSNGRTRKGSSSCKDRYWNYVDDNRRPRAGLQL
jgi:hypothetical protein